MLSANSQLHGPHRPMIKTTIGSVWGFSRRSQSWWIFFFLMSIFPGTGRSEYRENIEYGRAGDYSLRMDASIPEGPGPFPAAIIVHGGAWVAGDRQRSVAPLFRPLSSHGFAWFSISYRLASDISSSGFAAALTLGTQIDDVRQAVACVKSHAAEYRVDPNRIVLIGESAGGQLAAMAGLKPWPALKPGTALKSGADISVRAVVALYSPTDLATLASMSAMVPDSLRQAVKNSSLDALLMAGLKDLSPINWVRKDSPPFLLIHGTADRLVPFEQSKEMCKEMRLAGARCDLYAVDGGGHGILWWEGVGLTGYKERMMSWLEKTLGS